MTAIHANLEEEESTLGAVRFSTAFLISTRLLRFTHQIHALPKGEWEDTRSRMVHPRVLLTFAFGLSFHSFNTLFNIDLYLRRG